MSRLWVEATWEHSKKVVVCKSKRESSMLVPWSQTSTLQMYENTNFCCSSHPDYLFFVQLLSHVRPFATPWTAAHQASLSFTISYGLLKLTSIGLVMPSNQLILSLLSPPAHNLFQHQGLFLWISSLHQVDKLLEFEHQPFQWIFRVDFPYNWQVWSPCYPRDS